MKEEIVNSARCCCKVQITSEWKIKRVNLTIRKLLVATFKAVTVE